MTRAQLRDVCSLITDGTHYTPRSVPIGVPFLTVKDMRDGVLDLASAAQISREDFDKTVVGNSAPRSGDVLFSKDGTVGKVHVVDGEGEFAVLSSIAILRPDSRLLDSRFLGHALRSPLVLRRALRLQTGTAIRRVVLSDLSRVEVPLPSLSEQRRIAGLLDVADHVRVTRRESVSTARILTQAWFAEMFDATNGAPHVPLAAVIEPERPITYGILKPGPDVTEGVPYVRVVDFDDSGIRHDSVRRTTHTIAAAYRRSRLEAGDVVMSIRGHVGRAAVVPPELDGANITQDSARLAIRGFETRFVIEAIRSAAVQAWMRKHIKGAAVQGINLADVRRIPILDVPLAEQRRFARRAISVDRVLSDARRHLAEAEALFASLQQRAFVGAL